MIKVTLKKVRLIGRKYQAYGTIFYIICEKNHAVLNDIDSKRSSSRFKVIICIIESGFLHAFSHIFFSFNEFALNFVNLKGIIFTKKFMQ